MDNKTKSQCRKLREVPIGQLREPPCEDRFDLELTDEESAFIKEIPLAVVYSKESRVYIIVKGRRRFHKAKALGFKNLPCFVLREVEHDGEALLVRLQHVLDFRKPFHVLEMARLVYQLREKEILHNGAVDLLGQHLGLLAMEGLYYFLEDKGENLSIYEVHKQNPRLRDVGLREKIETQIKAMQASGAKDEEIKEKVALIAYEVLFAPPTAQNPGKGANPGSDGQSARASRGSGHQTPGVLRGIKAKEYREIRARGENFVKQVEGLRPFLRKKELTAADAESLHKKGDEIQKAFMDFWLPFTVRAGPSA
jgi:hypothetical protein